MSQRCYGRLPARKDNRTLSFAAYAGPELPAPPETVDWTASVQSWGMMRNDSVGDCTCASAGHLIMSWSANAAGTVVIPTDDEVLAAYSAITGYDPASGMNDNGAVEVDVLNYWRRTGIAGNQITAFVSVDPQNGQHVRQAIQLFGGIYLGIDMPRSAERQTDDGEPWDLTALPFLDPIVGGHAVPALGYDAQYLKVITWGKVQLMSWAFLDRYCEEAYCLLDTAWLSTRGFGWWDCLWKPPESPGGFNLDQLNSDLAALQN
jgi:hypothetical protein